MNNTTFGDEDLGYYETVAGGAGAVGSFSVSVSFLCVFNFAGVHGRHYVW